MKVSYSKMILSGIIASTFFMVSCQKKGSATGVKPQLATDQKREPINNLEPKGVVTQTPEIPTADVKNLGRGTVANPASGDISTAASGDVTKAAPVAKKEEAKSDSTVKTETKTESKEQAKEKVEAKVEDKKESDDSKLCSEDIKTAEHDMNLKYTAFYDIIKNESAEDAEKIKVYAASLKACEALEAAYAKEKIEHCEVKTAKGNASITVQRWSESCDSVGTRLKELSKQENKYAARVEKAAKEAMTALKAEKLSVSHEAKPMFEQDNQEWNMFLVNGEIQSDSQKLIDAVTKKQVVCSITSAAAEKYDEGTELTLSVVSVSEYKASTKEDTVQVGSLINMLLKKSVDGEVAKESTKVVMSCANLAAKNFNVKKLKTALGSHIAVEVKKEAVAAD